MGSAARLLCAWVAAALVCVSSVARAQSVPGPLTPVESSQRRQIELRLDDVRGERDGTSTVLPWSVIALGIGAMVIGTTIGLEGIASCEKESCSSPFWPSWLVVGGAGVSTGGLIWLKLVHEDIAELESRRYHLQMQLDAYDTLRAARGERAIFQLRGSF